jgi:DNA polymerase-3 subunit epsilon
LKLLRAECKRAGVRWDFEDTDGRVIDPLRIYQTKHPRDLSAAYKEYVDAAGFDGAHDAEADVGATIAVLIGQLKRHEDLPRTVAELADFCFPARKGFADKTGKFSIRDGVHYFAFGKFKGQLATLQRGYLEWMMKGDFPKDAKEICAGLLGGRLK